MPKLVKCPTCGEILKTWGQENFQHCQIRHPIKEHLYIKSQSSKVSDEGIEPTPQKVPADSSVTTISEPLLIKQEKDTSTEETAPVSDAQLSEDIDRPKKETAPLMEPSNKKVKGETPLSVSSDLNLETEPEKKEDKDINPDDYEYQCSNCNELFNELNDGRCPDCGALLQDE